MGETTTCSAVRAKENKSELLSCPAPEFCYPVFSLLSWIPPAPLIDLAALLLLFWYPGFPSFPNFPGFALILLFFYFFSYLAPAILLLWLY